MTRPVNGALRGVVDDAVYHMRQRTPSQDVEYADVSSRLKALRTTDMALIVSPAQNEIAAMRKLGLDIEPHRKRMVTASWTKRSRTPKIRCGWCSYAPGG